MQGMHTVTGFSLMMNSPSRKSRCSNLLPSHLYPNRWRAILHQVRLSSSVLIPTWFEHGRVLWLTDPSLGALAGTEGVPAVEPRVLNLIEGPTSRSFFLNPIHTRHRSITPPVVPRRFFFVSTKTVVKHSNQ